MDLFWEHLDGLTAAYKTLERDFCDLRSEHERLTRVLQTMQLHEDSIVHQISSTSESPREELVDVCAEPSTPAVAMEREVIFKSSCCPEQGKHQLSEDSAMGSRTNMVCRQEEGRGHMQADSPSDLCNLSHNQEQGKAVAYSRSVSFEGLVSSDDVDVAMLSDEAFHCVVSHAVSHAETENRTAKVGFVEPTQRPSEISTPIRSAVSSKGIWSNKRTRETSTSSRSMKTLPSSRSIRTVPDLSDICDARTRWEALMNIFIRYRCRGYYRLRPCWKEKKTAQATRRRMIHNYVAELGAASQEEEPILCEWATAGKKKMFMFGMPSYDRDSGQSQHSPSCMLHPLSRKRMIWSALGLLLVSYDGMMLSLKIFEVQTSDAILVVEWAFRFFWLLDIVVCFRTGFYMKSGYEGRPTAAAQNYIRTWLAFDLVALVPDVVALMLVGDSSGGLFTFLKYLKVLKALRLVRLAKLTALVTAFFEKQYSIYAQLGFQMIKYSFLLMCWVHLVGCAWYAIGKIGDSKRNSWIIKAGVENVKLPQSYFVAIQWALCLLQGSTEIYPSFNSATEGSFSVVVMALTFFILVVFISYTTNILITLQQTWNDKVQKRRALQEFLNRHQISSDVAEAVRRFSEVNTQVQLKLDLNENDVTASLPKALHRNLLVEVRGPMVNVRNPVFVAIQRTLPECFASLCCDLLATLFMGPETLVYNYGENCDQTYFNVAGEVSYDHINNRALEEWLTMVSGATCKMTDSSMSQDMRLEKAFIRERLRAFSIEVGSQPICEPALWTTWRHRGYLRTTTHTGFLTLESDRFSLLVEHNAGLRSLCACQAIRFCRVLNSAGCNRSDLMTSSDVLTILRSHGEIGCRMRSSGIRPSFISCDSRHKMVGLFSHGFMA